MVFASELARVKDLRAFVWAKFKVYTAKPFKSVVPADFNTLEQNGGFEVFGQMVETTSVDDATLIVNKRTPMRETIMRQELLAILISLFLPNTVSYGSFDQYIYIDEV